MKRIWVGLKNKKVLIIFTLICSFFGLSIFLNNNVYAENIGQGGQSFRTQYEGASKSGCDYFQTYGPTGQRQESDSSRACKKAIEEGASGNGKKVTNAQEWVLLRCEAYGTRGVSISDGYSGATKNSKECQEESIKQGFSKKDSVATDKEVTKDASKSSSDNKPGEGDKDKDKDNKDKNSCAIEWIGWIVCPIVRGSTGVVVGLYNFMQANFLNIKSDQLFSNSGKGQEAFKHWVTFRDIANIFFVIMIAIIIFSQVTGVGISNYGIKKMLPKIIIYAILVNISWYIVVIAIDISNIVGSTLFKWLSNDGNWSFSSDVQKETSPVEGILTGTVATGALIAAGVTAALVGGATILLFIASAALAVVMTVFILMIREAAVIVLVVTSPLAFVAGLLPNTEGLFKKWIKLTKNMLMIYPICSLIVGGALFVSNLLYGVVDDPLLKIIYGVLPILSLFAIIAVIKTVLSFIDGLTGGNLRGALGRMSGRINAAAQDSNWARASRAKAMDRTIGGIAIGKNARNDKFEEGQYERDKAALEKLDKKKNKTAADYRRRARYGSRVASYEKSQNEGMVSAMTYSIGNNASMVNNELDKISKVKDPGQQRLMYGALAQAVTNSGLNTAGQAAAMSNIASSALSIGDVDQSRAVAAQIASKAGSDIKKVNPAAAKAVMQDFSSGNIKSVQDFENDISTYSGASAKQMADWSDMSSANVNDNKAFKAMQSAFNSGDQSKILQAQNMGKIAEQALTANANGTMSLTPDQQSNFMAMQKLAQLHTSQTSASQQAQAGSSDNTTSSSVTYGAPAAQVGQAPQLINDSNQNIQPRQTASDPTKPNRKFGAN